ncbi:MAG: NAD(P)H-dependent oxidoreductase [Geminicoccales bacterium]
MTHALILFAHPCAESFSSALHDVVIKTLQARSWSVDDCDLNAENFSPILTEAERRGYHEEPANIEPVRPYVERLQAADALILVFPVWNFGYPAILKGFFDRVFLPGVSFQLVDGKVQPNLQNITKLAAVTTYGGTRLRAFFAGDPPRRIVKRHLRYVCHAQAQTRYLALYDMNRATAEDRDTFLGKVEMSMQTF